MSNMKSTARGFDIVHSLARTRHQHIYRTGGGSHAAYMEQVYRQPRLQRAVSPRHRAILRIEEAVFRDPEQIIHCLSDRCAREIADRYGVASERLVTLRNGVDTQRFDPARRDRYRSSLRRELNVDGPMVLFVGSGFHRKGLDRAIRGLAGSGVRAQLMVVGKGDVPGFRSLARRLGVEDQVRFLGYRTDIEALHAAADMLMLPARYDPFGNAALEGLASGLPVATTREVGISEIMEHGVSGLILREDFSSAFHLLEDRSGLERIGAAGRRAAEPLTWSRHADEVLELYAKIRR